MKVEIIKIKINILKGIIIIIKTVIYQITEKNIMIKEIEKMMNI